MSLKTTHETYKALLQAFHEIHTLGTIGEVLQWDQEVMMPSGASAQRGDQMACLQTLQQRLLCDPKMGDRLALLEGATELTTVEKANVREARRAYDKATRIPPALLSEIAKFEVLSVPVWAKARKENDFASFAPTLQTMIRLKQEAADALRKGTGKDRYDALLDAYEPDERSSSIEALFSSLRPHLVRLLDRVKGTATPTDRAIFSGTFTQESQTSFSRFVIEKLGYNFTEGRLDISTHPFCSGNGSDVRITTRYDLSDPCESLFGCIHETGHALYEQGIDRATFGHPTTIAASFGIHESQSRLWENTVARSKAFWQTFYPPFQEAFPHFASVPLEAFWRSINHVEPSWIRTEADELTYNLHILLRFDLERAMLAGDLQASDLPGAWNERFTRDFGITPPTDTLGCLQDIHWPSGLFGYFPTYALGNLYAAQFYEQVQKDIPHLQASFAKGDFEPLRLWLREKIHRQGRIFLARQLVENVTGKPLSIDPLVSYLEQKYSAIYA